MARVTKEMVVEEELKALRGKVNSCKRMVRQSLASMGRELYFVSKLDGYRLLILATWAEKYKVSIDYILRLLVPIWAKKFQRHKNSSRGLGARVATVVGQKSEQILIAQTAKDFPAGENVDDWRWQRRKELLGLDQRGFSRPITIISSEHLRDSVLSYRQRIERRSTMLDKAVSNSKRRRRVYRGNPWL